eukprot:5879867-Pyramimonas_sp.AAC.1
MTLDEIGPACFDRYVQGEWASAGDHPSGEKLIDYMLVSTSLRHAVELSWDDASPRAAPRIGIRGRLLKEGMVLKQRTAEAPLPLTPFTMGPDRPW